MNSDSPRSGGCLCGEIRYQAEGQPYSITHCHCEDCRRSTGAPFVTWTSFRREKFSFTRGTPREIHWAGRIRSFCPSCGTALTFLSSAETDEIDVTVCSLDRPEELTPEAHIWTEDRLPWIRAGDGLPHYPRSRSD